MCRITGKAPSHRETAQTTIPSRSPRRRGWCQSVEATRRAISPSVTSSRARVLYGIPKAGNVGLKVYEVTGRCAAVLRNGWCEPGRYTANLSAKGLARGVYILKLESDAGSLTRKVVIE